MVETILILSEIPVRVLLEIKGMIGACDRSFQVPKDRVNPGKAGHLCAFSFADDVPIMAATGMLSCSEMANLQPSLQG